LPLVDFKSGALFPLALWERPVLSPSAALRINSAEGVRMREIP